MFSYSDLVDAGIDPEKFDKFKLWLSRQTSDLEHELMSIALDDLKVLVDAHTDS